MAGMFCIEVAFEHAAWRVLSDAEVPHARFVNEKYRVLHITVADQYIEKVSILLQNLRMEVL